MIENVHKHMGAEALTDKNRWRIITEASRHRGPGPPFFSPADHHHQLPAGVRAGGAGRADVPPLAYTKTLRHGRRGSGLAITLVPVIMGYFIRGKYPGGEGQPLEPLAEPGCTAHCSRPCWLGRNHSGIAAGDSGGVSGRSKQPGRFIPPPTKGHPYMPTTAANISVGKVRDFAADRQAFRTVPEVQNVSARRAAPTGHRPCPWWMMRPPSNSFPKTNGAPA